MILSILRDSLRADGLHIPARPSIESAQFVLYKKSSNGTSSSGVYRITLAEQQEKQVATRKGLHNNISRSCGSASAIVRLEIVGCIQKLNCPYITGWKQIAAVDLTVPNKKSKLGKTAAMMEQQEDDDTAIKNIKKSVKIGGFYPGHRYQIAVRVVDKDGMCSLYSKPIYITPPIPKPEDAKKEY